MTSIYKNRHPIRRLKSFQFAFEGIYHALINEANFQIQFVIAALSIIAGFFYKISPIEWSLLILSNSSLLSAEILNTAVEELIDYFFKEESVVAKLVKDLAAGFVLINAFATLFIVILIFGQRFIPFASSL